MIAPIALGYYEFHQERRREGRRRGRRGAKRANEAVKASETCAAKEELNDRQSTYV